MAATKLWPASRRSTHAYVGPLKFRARCENCGEPRNKHCGRCKGCPPEGHEVDCMKNLSTGAWH